MVTSNNFTEINLSFSRYIFFYSLVNNHLTFSFTETSFSSFFVFRNILFFFFTPSKKSKISTNFHFILTID